MYETVYIPIKMPPCISHRQEESRAILPPVKRRTFFSPFDIHYSPLFLASFIHTSFIVHQTGLARGVIFVIPKPARITASPRTFMTVICSPIRIFAKSRVNTG